MNSDFESFWEALKSSKDTAVFTGAGASTLSGIKDFRGKDGVYSKPWQGYSVEDILSIPFFRKDPSIFYAWAREFCYCLDRFKPCIVHTVLAKLEEKGMIGGVMTQNIDVLHQAAGSKRVLEVHGSPSNHHCLKCRKTFSYDEIAPTVMDGKVPYCDCGGVIKPDIIFYGESLDADTLDACFDWATRCELMIVLGSSLTVQPAASIPLYAWKSGAKICIVNAQATPLDSTATWHFDDLKTFSEAIENHLDNE
ncbi:MAG: NAD-dependent deacetylase [Proteobacteria bacterium]|nr:NAD-dependent deacetylase [Pseudomonadota bacterium]